MLIPLSVILLCRPKGKSIRILKIYVLVGFLLNTLAMVMWEFSEIVPKSWYVEGMPNNNILYNLHSVMRVIFFSAYIMTVRSYRYPIFFIVILAAYFVFIPLNFTVLKDRLPLFLSSHLFAAESIVLLLMSMSYFFNSINDDSPTNWLKHPSFIICSGVSLYVVITFFVFLFFYPLSDEYPTFFVVMMDVYFIAFVILCIILAIGLYRSKSQSHQAFQPGT